MNIGQAEDYAVRTLVDLAAHPDTRIQDIAARTDIPAPNVAKIIQSLVRAGLVETTRGRAGGARLARDPGEINLLEVLEAIQGRPQLLRCPRRGNGCPVDPDCRLYRFWTDLEMTVAARLGEMHITDLLQSCSTIRFGTL
jgi:Rrf2 family protein